MVVARRPDLIPIARDRSREVRFVTATMSGWQQVAQQVARGVACGLLMTPPVALLAPSPARAAPPAERIGAYVEASGGLNLAGAVDGTRTDEATTGAAFGLRGGYRLLPYLALGAAVEVATLPASDAATGNFTFAGVEAAGYLPLAVVDLVAAAAIGYDVAHGANGEYSGFGGVRLRAGVRVPIAQWFEAGADYALVLPRASETVEADGVRYRVEPAWLHQLSVVAVVPFW